MPAYKDAQKGTWYAAFYYQDWKGIKKKKLKRGFPTKKEALAWERTFLLQQAADLTMTFEAFVEIYIVDKQNRLRENTWSTKEHKPTDGKVLIEGTDISTMNRTQAAIFRRRKVGLVYQFYNLIPTLTVRKNILMPLLLDKRNPNKEYFEKIVHSLGIEDKLEALPSQLSGGQQQRVAIARSLIYRPALLLADEPTGNLDRKNGEEIIDLLKLSNRNLEQTILLITHDEKIALEADRVITIEDGKIVGDQKRR